ncbi:MAG: sensor histidine kinase [Methylophilus sp.]|nr:sensor histidine kinase [Methylophilus sp.]
MTSLKARLSWGLTVSLVVLFTLQWFLVSYAISSLTENQLVERLQRESENLLSIVEFSPSHTLQLDAKRMGAIYQRPLSGHYYSVSTPQQQAISRSLWDASLNLPAILVGQVKKLKLTGPEQQPLLVVLHGYKKQNQVITIAVAENIKPLQANIQRFQLLYAGISALGLCILLYVQRRMVVHALTPLHTIQANLAKLERGESGHLDMQAPEEISPLVDEINRLLTAMDRKYHRSRESVGNLAHALKTRLTLLNQTAEKLDTTSPVESKSAIYASTEVMHQIIERELKRARLIGDTRPGRQVDLALGISELVSTLRQIYAQKNVNITWELIAEAKFFGDKEDLMEVLGNLLDNACKWSSNRVSLTVIGGDGTSFVIEDDGTGASPDDLNLLTRRGFRADESKPGSGLGLAIVNDMVESYHGTLIFGRSAALGGLRVEVKFNHTKQKE